MSTSRVSLGKPPLLPVLDFQYRQLTDAFAPAECIDDEVAREPEVTMTEEHLRRLITSERAAAGAEVEQKLREEYDRRRHEEALCLSSVIEKFERSRQEYFARVETDVVSLALSIAGKILHREAQVDPLLLTAIVQIAVTQLKDGSTVLLRVRPEEASRWRTHFDGLTLKLHCTVQADPDLVPGDCILETGIGSANFSLDAQLKEVENGFLDVLASRPQL